jgi:hypothetical protein
MTATRLPPTKEATQSPTRALKTSQCILPALSLSLRWTAELTTTPDKGQQTATPNLPQLTRTRLSNTSTASYLLGLAIRPLHHLHLASRPALPETQSATSFLTAPWSRR